jgi:NTE family protein
VLSGGGNYGALQAGAVEALLAHGIEPDMLVGVSAGALNAAWLAAHPTHAGARRLAQIWRNSAPAFFPPLSRMRMSFRLVRSKDSLLPNDRLQQFVRKWALAGTTFGEYTRPRLYVGAARLADGALRVFGDRASDRLLDALMASTALPPLYPPWEVDGVAYIDGGVVSDVPVRVAVTHGADEIFALQIRRPHATTRALAGRRGIVATGTQAIEALVHRVTELEIETISHHPRVRLHLIPLCPSDDPGFWNFTQADGLISDGRRAMERYLTGLTAAHRDMAPAAGHGLAQLEEDEMAVSASDHFSARGA